MKTQSNYHVFIIALTFSAFFNCIAPAFAQFGGVAVYKKEFNSDPSKYFMDTVHFNSTQLLFIEKREWQQWWTEEGYRITIPPRDEALYLDLSSTQAVERRYNFSKKRYEVAKETAMVPDWTIHDEFNTIGAYKVQKATGVRQHAYGPVIVTAWFTPEIPVPGGPSRQWGLPGLIIEYHEDKLSRFFLESISFNPTGDITPEWIEEAQVKSPKKSTTQQRSLSELLSRDGN